MSETLVKTQEELNRVVSELKSAATANGGRIGQTETAISDLREAQRGISLAQAAINAHVPSGSSDDVSRAYCASVSAEPVLTRGEGRLDYDGANSFGAKDVGIIKMLGSTDAAGFWAPGLLDDPKPKTEWQHKLQIMVDTRSMARTMVRGGRTPKLDKAILAHMSKGPGMIAKVFADNAGEGAEWIPDNVSPELQRSSQLQRMLEGLFETMPIGSGNTTNPFLSQGCTPYIAGQPSSGDFNPGDLEKSMFTTADRTVTPVTLAVSLPYNRDAEEDSVIQFAPIGRQMLVEADRDGTEDAILNADTGTHGDTGLTGWNPRDGRWGTASLGGANDHRRSWIGLRQRAIDVSSHVDKGSAQTYKDMMSFRLQMNVAQAFGDLVYCTSPEYFLAKLLTDTNTLTVDKFGLGATVLTGEVAKIGGHPLILSEFMSPELNASGVYDDTTKTKTGLVVFNRSRFKMAIRRGARVESETVVRNHTSYLVLTTRKKFHTFDSSTTKNVAYAYNLAIS